MAEKQAAWLIWNGVYTLAGSCNAQGLEDAPDTTAPNRVAVRVGAPRPAEIVADAAISVRIEQVVLWGAPGSEYLMIQTWLKRVQHMKSLMLLIYRNYDPQQAPGAGTLVYKEILDQSQIRRLAGSDPTTSSRWATIAKLDEARQLKAADPDQAARKEHTPYKVRVWVSNAPGAFASFDGSRDPAETWGATVHDQSQSWKKRGGKYLDPKADDRPDDMDAETWRRLVQQWQRLAIDEAGRNLVYLSSAYLVLEDAEGKPSANARYEVWIGGEKFGDGERRTGADGALREDIPPVKEVELRVWLDEMEQPEVFLLELGGLDPIDTIAGVQDRLNNLGYDCGDEDGEIGPQSEAAITAFRADNNISPADGPLDEATRSKLLELHGS